MKPITLRVLIAVLATFFLSGCEEIVDADGLPYEEKLVVHGVLTADSVVKVQISRTVPLNSRADTTDAFLSNVTGSVSDGTTSYPLVYMGYGSFYRIEGLRPRHGVTYTLHASWGTLSASATTRIPQPAVIDTAYVTTVNEQDWSYDAFFVRVFAAENEAYQHGRTLTFFIDRTGDTVNTSVNTAGYEVLSRSEADSLNRITFEAGYYGGSSQYEEQIHDVQIYSFDGPYYDYYRTRYFDFDFFSGQPGTVKWNVTGDAIGIFVGNAIASKAIVTR